MGVEGRFYKDRYDKLDINVKSSNNDLEIILKQLDDATFFDGYRYEVCVFCGGFHYDKAKIIHHNKCPFELAKDIKEEK